MDFLFALIPVELEITFLEEGATGEVTEELFCLEYVFGWVGDAIDDSPADIFLIASVSGKSRYVFNFFFRYLFVQKPIALSRSRPVDAGFCFLCI